MVLLILFLICAKVYVSYKSGNKADAVFFGVVGAVLAGLFLLLSTL
ncbi:hypothetical protein GPL15_25780 [Clostridium sp. MCC353]|nr:hypothetical protein [Clostridium sp. MCC353]MBT9779886.1 hypothetical protein [Clostridium sp. MCC353]